MDQYKAFLRARQMWRWVVCGEYSVAYTYVPVLCIFWAPIVVWFELVGAENV